MALSLFAIVLVSIGAGLMLGREEGSPAPTVANARDLTCKTDPRGDDCAQWEGVVAAADSAKWSFAQMVLSGIGIVLSGAGFVGVMISLGFNRAALQKAAEANQIAADAQAALYRPRVRLLVSGPLLRDGNSMMAIQEGEERFVEICADIQFKNIGEHPVTLLRSVVAADVLRNPYDTSERSDVLAPGEAVPIWRNFGPTVLGVDRRTSLGLLKVTRNEKRDILERAIRVRVIVYYMSVLDEMFEHSFCYKSTILAQTEPFQLGDTSHNYRKKINSLPPFRSL